MDFSALQKAGLTPGETKVYLALVELGSSSIGPILEESQVTKSIIYRILDRLIKKGLASYVTHEKVKHFQAAPPEHLLEYVEKQEKTLQQTKLEVQNLIPQLKMKQAMAKKSTATIFEGFKGIMTAYDKRYDALKKGDEVVIYGLPVSQPEYFHAKWLQANKRLDEAGIRSKLLYNYEVNDDVLASRNSYQLCEARRMPKGLSTPSWVMIYKDTVLIAIPLGEHPLAIEIINKEIATSFLSYFETLWEQSK